MVIRCGEPFNLLCVIRLMEDIILCHDRLLVPPDVAYLAVKMAKDILT